MLRYLEKVFGTPMGQSYRPFLRKDLEKMPHKEMYLVEYDDQYNLSERMLKEAESFAHQIGKRQIVYYTKEQKAQKKNNMLPERFAYGNGVNRLCCDDVPDEEKITYYTRLGYFLGEGRMPVNVALFEPEEDECRLFSKHGIPYHILTNEGMTKYGYSKDGKIGCGICEYTYLVLPSEASCGKVMSACVDQFVKEGGRLLRLDETEGSRSRWISNCSYGEIEREQRYVCENPETMLYVSYHRLNEMEFLYVTNPSAKNTYTQSFAFKEQVHSFLRLNLMDFTTAQVPLAITLAPGEEAILVPYGRKVE